MKSLKQQDKSKKALEALPVSKRTQLLKAIQYLGRMYPNDEGLMLAIDTLTDIEKSTDAEHVLTGIANVVSDVDKFFLSLDQAAQEQLNQSSGKQLLLMAKLFEDAAATIQKLNQPESN